MQARQLDDAIRSRKTRAPEGAKPRLPKLRPHVNRRAQQIIAAHLQSADIGGPSSSTATVPVLTKLETTAPKTARTSDVSHLFDQKGSLSPSIPPTLIQEEDHVYETSFMPKDVSSTYSEEDGLWHTKVFPSEKPSSRMDAVMLDTWITRSLQRYQETVSFSEREDFTKTVEDLVPILSVSLHELVRQVKHHCSERGVALERIWRTYVELFHRVLKQLQESLRNQKKKTAEVNQELLEANQEFKALKKAHPEQMHQIISQLEVRFTQRQQGFEEELAEVEQENATLKMDLRNRHRELELWFPGFPSYQDSYMKALIPQHKNLVDSRTVRKGSIIQKQEEATAPEVAIAEDFKRLLAVLPPDKRASIGSNLLSLLDGRDQETEGRPRKDKMRATVTVASLEEQQQELQNVEKLQAEVSKQEEQITRLKQQIAKLEARKAFPDDDIDDSDEEEQGASGAAADPAKQENEGEEEGDATDFAQVLAGTSAMLLEQTRDGRAPNHSIPKRPSLGIRTPSPPIKVAGSDDE
eukprot:TRINITY_DN63228_c0_g1_i1.p1 TRINITY_DN63228_c0_g1~~TRINITY_DN63228_c0_g1_i1.p1  ORF type:complete len:525 (+),score=145.50 TRINITY_DN63228_c0_g1_i1:47-1621(+)